jgi:hypothetical protein
MTAATALVFSVSVVLLSWGVFGIVVAGMGGVLRLWGRSGDEDQQPTFWIGLGAVIALLQVWNLFSRISAAPLIIVLVVGLPLGVAWLISHRRQMCENLGGTGSWVALAFLAAWLADRALAPANASDSGLYHLPAIRLAGEYAIIPGIGNLMPAFAINSGAFLLNAMLNVGPLAGRGWHVVNSLLLFAFILRIWPASRRVLRGEGKSADGFDAAMIPLCLFLLLGKDISSPKTDLPAGLLLLVMASQLARILCDREKHALRADVIAAALLGGAAVCVKISAAPMAGLLWLGFVITWFVRERPAMSVVARAVVPLALIAALLPGVFIARNIITSGYPLFPAAALRVDVDWRLQPEAVAKYHRGFGEFTRFDLAQGLAKKIEATPARFYARLMDPGFNRIEDATATNWIRGWFFMMLVAWPIEVAVPLHFAAVLWMFGRRGDETSRRARNVIAGVAAITLFLWFITVPDGRYIWFATWAVAGAAAIPAFAAGARKRRTLIIGFSTVCLAVIVFRVGLQLIYRDGPIADVFIVRPGPDHGFHPPPVSVLTTWTSRHGMTLSYPANGSGTVWYSPQPATTVHYLDPDLRLRGEDFQSGVMIDRLSSSLAPVPGGEGRGEGERASGAQATSAPPATAPSP